MSYTNEITFTHIAHTLKTMPHINQQSVFKTAFSCLQQLVILTYFYWMPNLYLQWVKYFCMI